MNSLAPATLRFGRLLLLSSMSAIGVAVLAAISLSVIDIYVTGHGGQSLMRPWISWGSWVQLSRGDALFYLISLIAVGATFLLALEHPEQHET